MPPQEGADGKTNQKRPQPGVNLLKGPRDLIISPGVNVIHLVISADDSGLRVIRTTNLFGGTGKWLQL